MTLIFRAPRLGDAETIAEDIRPMDALECRCLGQAPLDALRVGMSGSTEPVVVEGSHGPIVAFGIIPISVMDRQGLPWLLGTTETPRHARALLGLSRPRLDAMAEGWRVLENIVHAENRQSIRWLRFLGFAVEPELLHVGGQPFRRFTRLSSACVFPFSPPQPSPQP